jgi:hypothetical protein
VTGVYRYKHKHSCRPLLHEAMEDMELLTYGTVTRCRQCPRSWIILPSRPFTLRRVIKAYGEAGWWVLETQAQGRRRQDRIAEHARIDATFKEIVSQL